MRSMLHQKYRAVFQRGRTRIRLRRATKGCGCVIAVLLAVAVAGLFAYLKWVRPWLQSQPPPASGGELTVRILDVGPINRDSILITSPAGKTVLLEPAATRKRT